MEGRVCNVGFEIGVCGVEVEVYGVDVVFGGDDGGGEAGAVGGASAGFEGFVAAPEGVGRVRVGFFAARVEGADPSVGD